MSPAALATSRFQARLVKLTSSSMPIVKCVRGDGSSSSAKTAQAIPGVNSFDPSP